MKKQIRMIRMLCMMITMTLIITFFGISEIDRISVVHAASKTPKINYKTRVVQTGDTFTLKLSNSTSANIKWSSKSKKIASVTQKGKVTAKKNGNTVISAKYKGKVYSCNVKVIKKLKAVNGISIEQTGKGKVGLSWKKVSGATGYQVFGKAGKGKNELLKTSNSNKVDINNLEAGKKYTFMVKPFCKYKQSYTYGKNSNSISLNIVGLEYNKSGDVSTISDFSTKKINDSLDVIEELEKVSDYVGIKNIKNEVELVQESELTSDAKVYTYQQEYKGNQVFGREITVLVSDKVIDSANLSVIPDECLESVVETPEIQVEKAVDIVNQYSSNVVFTDTELGIYSFGKYKTSPCLSYRVLDEEKAYYVDALDGTVIAEESMLLDVDTEKVNYTEANEKGEIIEFSVIREGGILYLKNDNPSVEVFEKKHEKRKMSLLEFFSDIINWVKGAEGYFEDGTAVSAYTNTVKSLSWWENKLGINGIDNSGKALPVIIHDDSMKGNAYWNSVTKTINFCDGNPSGASYTCAASLDVVQHEMTHGIVSECYKKRLTGCPVASTVGEGVADIFTAIMTEDWLLANDIYEDGCVRDIENPLNTGNPLSIDGKNYKQQGMDTYDREHDYGYCHKNSTVISHTAYEMYKNGLSYEKLFKLWNGAMILLSPSEDMEYEYVYNSLMLSAMAYSFSDEEKQIITDAFVNAKIIEEPAINDIVTKNFEKIPLYISNVKISEKGKYIEITTDLYLGRYIEKSKINKSLKIGSKLKSQGISYTVIDSYNLYPWMSSLHQYILKDSDGNRFYVDNCDTMSVVDVAGYCNIWGMGENGIPYAHPILIGKNVKILLDKIDTKVRVSPGDGNGYKYCSAYTYFIEEKSGSLYYGTGHRPFCYFGGWIDKVDKKGHIKTILEDVYP